MPLFKFFRPTAMLFAVSLLSACFVSDAPLIPAGEASLPVDYQLTLCPDEPDKCVVMEVSADGYVTKPEFEDDGAGVVRFSPLTQIDGRQIFIMEAHDLEDDTYTYLVARRRDANAVGAADLDLALLSCSDLDETQKSEFEANGGRISSGLVGSCKAPDLATLSSTLREAFSDQLADETWWTAKGDP